MGYPYWPFGLEHPLPSTLVGLPDKEEAVDRIMWSPRKIGRIDNRRWNELREPRLGVMIHYDGSRSDAGAMAWFRDPLCRVSYQALVLRTGDWVQIAPDDMRAWHAGTCAPSDDWLEYRDANSAFYGIAAAGDCDHRVRPVQLLTMAWLTRQYFEQEGWPLGETWRITGHEDEAWPRGRRIDPAGVLAVPVLGTWEIRELLPLIGGRSEP